MAAMFGNEKWRGYGWIVLAALVAHVWCLGSVFYMDDFPQIVENERLLAGELPKFGKTFWTQLVYLAEYRVFGMSPMGFHAVNLLLHTGVACALYALGSELLGSGKWRVALFGALLFAVHPLCSEIPNYVRTQDLAWVSLFSLLAAWAVAVFFRTGKWQLLGWAALAVVGATFSKGPGFFHALMMVLAVVMGSVTRENMARVGKRGLWIAVAGLAAACVWVLTARATWQHAIPHMDEPRFIGHAYTVARVFWEFAWRAVVPIKLCSDHLVTETLVRADDGWLSVQDGVAKLAMAGMWLVGIVGAVLVLRGKQRVLGMCIFVFAGTMIFRIAYLIPEFMPEYRIYPGMPWFCLGAAIVLAQVFRKMPGKEIAAGALVVVLAVMSAKRSLIWHDVETLAGNVLWQYPARARAVWEMEDEYARRGEWEKIIETQQKVWPHVFNAFIEQTKALRPVREVPSGDIASADVSCHGWLALAVAHTRSPAMGLAVLDQLEARMKALQMGEETHKLQWGYFYRAKAKVLELAGRNEEALAILKSRKAAHTQKADIRRLEQKVQGGQ